MTRRRDVQLCYPFEEKRFNDWPKPCFIQPKLDGVRCRAELDSDIRLLSSEGHPLNFALPHIVERLEDVKTQFYANGIFELDGEIYSHEDSFEEITSITSRTTNRHPNHKHVEFWIFDHVSSQPFTDRLNQLVSSYNLLNGYLQLVPTEIVGNLDGVIQTLNRYVDDGYEGIILRHPSYPYVAKRSTGMMKFKPRRNDTYTIDGWKEEMDKNGNAKGTLGALILKDPEGNIFSAGSGLTQRQRVDLWEVKENLPGKTATIAYQHTTNGGVPRFPVLLYINEFE